MFRDGTELILLFPSQIREATRRIAETFEITGPLNIQFIVKDDNVKVTRIHSN